MFAYNLRLAAMSFRQNPLLTGLIITALALGIGLSMTIITLYYTMSSNPIPKKSAELFAVRIDNWELDSDDNDGQPPWQLTFTDAQGLLQSPVPSRQVAMYKATFVVDSEREEVAPFFSVSRVTGRDFFSLFDVPFLYGGAWSQDSEDRAEHVVVLSKATNDRIFGGENSVGKRVNMGNSNGDYYFTVVGVLDNWQPVPKYYDVNNGAFDDVENLFVPFSLTTVIEMNRTGNTNCWKAERLVTYTDVLNSECVWLQYWVELNSEQQQQDYRQWLDGYVSQQKQLGRLDRPMDNRIDDVMSWLQANEVIPVGVNVLMGLSILFLLVCIFNAVSLLLARFFRKATLIGVRRALGASKWDVFNAQLLEVVCIGVAGGLLGLFFTWLGLRGLRSLFTNFSIERVSGLNVELVIIALLLAVSSALIAGLYPTWRISRISPAYYLKTQ